MKKIITLLFLSFITLTNWAQTDITKLACALGKDYNEPIVWEAIEMLKAYKWSGYFKSELVVKTVSSRDEFIEFISKCSTSGSSLNCYMPEQNIRIELRGGFVRDIKFPVSNETQLPDFIKVDRSYKTTLKLYPHYSRFVKKDCNIKKGENCDLGRIEENVPVPFYAFYETVVKNDVLLSSITLAQPDKPYAACVSAVSENEPVTCLLGQNINDTKTQAQLEKYGVYVQKKYDSKTDEYKMVITNTSKKISVTESNGTIKKMIVYDLNLLPAGVRKLASKKELLQTIGIVNEELDDNIYDVYVDGKPMRIEIFNGYYSGHSADKNLITEKTPPESILNISFTKVATEFTDWNDFLNKIEKGTCIYGDCQNGFGRYKCADGNTIIANFKNGLPVGNGALYKDELECRTRKWNENGKLLPISATELQKMCIEGDCTNGFGIQIDGKIFYRGEFKDSQYNGEGNIIDYNTFSRHSGTFLNGKKHGYFITVNKAGEKEFREYKNGIPQKTSEELAEEQRKKQAEELKKLAAEEREKRSLKLEIEEAVKIKKLKESNPVLNFKCESGNCQNGFGKARNSTEGYTYEGSFKEGIYHGVGTMIWKNGDIYIGEFSYGIGHGNGYFRHGNESYDGPFEYGQATCKTCWKGNNDANVKYNSSNQWLLESIERQQNERDRWDAWQNAPTFEQYMEQRKYNVND